MNSSRNDSMYLWRCSAMARAVGVFIMSLRRRSFSWKWLTVVPLLAKYSASDITSRNASPGTCIGRPLLPP